jgi:fluoride exporter
MNMLIAIAVGGGVGALGRHFLSSAVAAILGTAFPWGIFVVNILGGFLMGLIVEMGALKLDYSLEMRAFLTTGLLGGFTTFSAFSLDASLMIERGDWMGAMFYVAGSALLSIGALFAGLWLVRSL